MRLATWNVNSIRSRVDRVVGFLERSDADVLALQETKCRDDQFPTGRFAALGYEVAHVGHNQWNGVAVASRIGLSEVTVGFDGMPSYGEAAPPEARALGVTVGSAGAAVRLWSLYVPNGRALGDPHLAYKLEWLAALGRAAATWRQEEPDAAVALVGDWNIAPRDEDVWSVAYYADKTHTSPGERAGFQGVLDAGYLDVVRPFLPGPGEYTYWDYTNLRFPRRQGMRIDFVLGSPAFAERVRAAEVDRDERKGKGASDHAPVLIEIDDT